MHSIGVICGVIILGIGIYFANQSSQNLPDIDSNINITPIEPTEETSRRDDTVKLTPILSPTYKPIITSNPPNNFESSDNIPLNSLIYPYSTVVSSSLNRLQLTSGENPDTITNWYKEKINNMGKNIKSFITTKTNNNIINKLVTSGENETIQIEITKLSDSNITSITIVID